MAAWAAGDDLKVSDRSLIWNTDLTEALEYENLILQAVGDHGEAPPTARKAAAPTPARITPAATTANWMKHTLASDRCQSAPAPSASITGRCTPSR